MQFLGKQHPCYWCESFTGPRVLFAGTQLKEVRFFPVVSLIPWITSPTPQSQFFLELCSKTCGKIISLNDFALVGVCIFLWECNYHIWASLTLLVDFLWQSAGGRFPGLQQQSPQTGKVKISRGWKRWWVKMLFDLQVSCTYHKSRECK